MADEDFAVVFAGRIADGADAQQVRANLAKLFKVELAKVEPMFSGKPIIIKKNLPESTAKTYQAALAKAGALTEVVVTPSANMAAPAAAVQASKTTPEPTPEVEPPPPPQAPDLSIAAAGTQLVDATPVPRADFDTTGFDLAEVGSNLVDPVVVPPASFDISGMDLEPPGTLLAEPHEVLPANFDTTGLSLVEDD